MYAWYLSTLGWRVIEARDGLEALRRARECPPDAIALDLSLPVLAACEVIRRLRTEVGPRCVPIIGLNGYGLGRYSQEAVEAGCCRVLVKPCSPDTLAMEIRRVLMMASTAQATGPAAVSP